MVEPGASAVAPADRALRNVGTHPALHGYFETIGGAIWGAVLILTIFPLAVYFVDSRPGSALKVRREAEYKIRMERQLARETEEAKHEIAKFAQLNPNSSLRDLSTTSLRATAAFAKPWKARAKCGPAMPTP
jgi:hypothetical protein